MKYYKIKIQEKDSVKTAVMLAETKEEVEKVCVQNKIKDYEIAEIGQGEFNKLKGKSPETKEELVKKWEESHKKTEQIDITKFKGKKIIPFEGCPYKIEEKYQEATKENILVVASSLNPFGFKDAKSAARYLMDIGFEIK